MSVIFVVDSDAVEICSRLNAAWKRDGAEHACRPFLSPDAALAAMRGDVPALILLHHTWAGLTIRETLERVASVTADVRVVIFTGRALNMREVMECVRYGVCDYWQKSGDVDFSVWARQLSALCDSGANMMSRLSQATGSVLHLLDQAEAEAARLDRLSTENCALRATVRELRSKHNQEVRRAVIRAIEWAVSLGLLVTAFVTLLRFTGASVALIVVGMCAGFFLISQGKVTRAIVDFGNRVVELRKGH